MSPRLLERVAVITLLLLALVPRVRDIASGFDREFEGYQGAFFAIAAVNYERLGLDAAGGYPIMNIDLPGGAPEAARQHPQQWFVYQNHPPTTALLAWGALELMGPGGWSEAWESDRSPRGIEAPLRFPFLLLHLAALAATWWVARVAFGSQVALIALALSVYLPVSAMYGTMVNFENPSLPFVLLAVGAYGLHVRTHSRRALAGMGCAFLVGCSVTFAPLFFLPPLVLRSCWRRRWKQAGRVALVGGLACALPILGHAALAQRSLEALEQTPVPIQERAQTLLAPLLDGSIPLSVWAPAQLDHASYTLGTILTIIAAMGLLICLIRGSSSSWDERLSQGEWPRQQGDDVDLATPLAFGAALLLFGYYKHTSEEQWSFWLYMAPAVAILAARALHQLSLPLQKLRGGIGPLVLAVGTLMLLSLANFEAWRARARNAGPQDRAELSSGPDAPLPATVGAQLAELLPPGSVGLHPSELGLNLASAWYAWRSLLPISSLDDPVPGIALDRLGLAEAPRMIVMPNYPAASAAPAILHLRTALGPADASVGDWQAWNY